MFYMLFLFSQSALYTTYIYIYIYMCVCVCSICILNNSIYLQYIEISVVKNIYTYNPNMFEMYMTCTYILYIHKSHCMLYLNINSIYYTFFVVAHTHIYIYNYMLLAASLWGSPEPCNDLLVTQMDTYSHHSDRDSGKVPGYDWAKWPRTLQC